MLAGATLRGPRTVFARLCSPFEEIRRQNVDGMESIELITDRTPIPASALPVADPSAISGKLPHPGGSRELLGLAVPLIVSQSFMTVQVFVDTVLLSWHDPLEMAASFPAIMWYWLPFGLLQVTAGYTSTFIAQYTGAGRPHRVGPAVWQGIYFALVAGLLFFLMAPAAPFLISLGGHTPAFRELKARNFGCWPCAPFPLWSI